MCRVVSCVQCVSVPLVWSVEDKVEAWAKTLHAMPALRELVRPNTPHPTPQTPRSASRSPLSVCLGCVWVQELDGSGVEGEVALALHSAWTGTHKAARRLRRLDMAHCNITEEGTTHPEVHRDT